MGNGIKIKSTNDSSFLKIEILEINHIGEQSCKLVIEFESSRIKSRFTPWIEIIDIENFITELMEIEKRRSGKAELKGMSPEELNITVENYDSLGHFILIIKLGDHVCLPQNQYSGMTGFLDIGSEYFLSVIEAFKMIRMEYDKRKGKTPEST